MSIWRSRADKPIAIIGPYPPPFGGISVHIQRVLSYLGDGSFRFFNETESPYPGGDVRFSGRGRYLKTLRFLFGGYRLVHHHSPDKRVRLLLSLIGFFNRYIYLHIHGASLKDSLGENGLGARLLRRTLRNVHVLADNSDIVRLAEDLGCRTVRQIDAFLPPVYESVVDDDFCSSVRIPECDVILTTVGWFIKYNDEDLYGFDLLLEALLCLRQEHGIDAVIVAGVNGIRDEQLHREFMKKLEDCGLQDYFVLIGKREEIYPLYLSGDIFIRATNTDGSPLSIKEALWFESKVVASDCVPRPDGVTLFKSRDVDDLVQKITAEIENGFESREVRRRNMQSKKFTYKLFSEVYGVA